MMDKVAQEGNPNVKELLIQRDLDRKAKIKTLKEEKEASAPNQAKIFEETFEEHINKIFQNVKLIEERKVEQKDLPEYFDRISKDIHNLNRYLSVTSTFLTNYSVRKCMKTIEEAEVKVKELEAEFLPKKKFGFKAHKTKINDKSDQKPNKERVDEVDTNVNKRFSFSSISCGFSDKKNEKLEIDSEIIAKNDVELRNLENCSVHLYGNPSTIHISSVTECTILSGPVSTSVFVENCKNCSFVLACQQLRIHSTSDSKFYIHVTSRAIIEDSSNVHFAPYNLKYEGVSKDFEVSGLNTDQNNWNKVDDFNWLASDVPSPNWKIISEEDRVQSWPL